MRPHWLLSGLIVFAFPDSPPPTTSRRARSSSRWTRTYQDMGMLRAYGLVYELLRQNVPVRWMIKVGKMNGRASTSRPPAIDIKTNAVIAGHGYRGGPVGHRRGRRGRGACRSIKAWQASNPRSPFTRPRSRFTGDVARTLIVAPTIAMMADGNQKIARKYMLAAGIPDSTGNLAVARHQPGHARPRRDLGARQRR